MIDYLKNIIPYEITLVISIISPLVFYLYRLWLKSRYDKKLERVKSELQKEVKKHEIRLENYKNYYQKVDEIQRKLKDYSVVVSEEIAEISRTISETAGLAEAMNYKNYVETYSKINQVVYNSMLDLQNQTNEFRFYASDNLLKYIEELDNKYSLYFSYSMNNNLSFLQDSFEKAKNLDFVGLLKSMNTITTNDQSSILQSEIVQIHETIKKEMRKELNLNN